MGFPKKKKPTGMTGGKPRVEKPTASKIKKLLQAKLREKAIERDGMCVIGQHLDSLPDQWRLCGNYTKDGRLILQAEHLVGRANSRSYADMDNIVLICLRHHFFFKQQCGALYWDIIRRHIGEERWGKIEAWEKDKSPHHMVAGDWQNILDSLC